jgi:hypothetical protein
MSLFNKPKVQIPLQMQAEFMGIVEKTATELIIYICTSVIQNKFRYVTSISNSS